MIHQVRLSSKSEGFFSISLHELTNECRVFVPPPLPKEAASHLGKRFLEKVQGEIFQALQAVRSVSRLFSCMFAGGAAVDRPYTNRLGRVPVKLHLEKVSGLDLVH